MDTLRRSWDLRRRASYHGRVDWSIIIIAHSHTTGEAAACLVRVPTENVKQKMQAGMYRTTREAVMGIITHAQVDASTRTATHTGAHAHTHSQPQQHRLGAADSAGKHKSKATLRQFSSLISSSSSSLSSSSSSSLFQKISNKSSINSRGFLSASVLSSSSISSVHPPPPPPPSSSPPSLSLVSLFR